MSELTVFNFKEKEVRTINIDSQVWFVAKDIAEILEYSDTQVMTRRLDDDEKGMQNLHTHGGMQELTIINESGLYNAILGSNKPEAKTFKKWVTSEVLPSIRKTGKYEKESEKDVEKKDLINVIKRMSNQIVETNKFLLNYFGHKQTDDEIWISTQELLELANYKSKGNVTYHSKKEGWICRPIAGKLQHYEYKLESLPVDIQTKFYEKYNKDE